MSESKEFEFRTPHGIRKIECQTQCWNKVTARQVVHYPNSGRAWHDLSSKEATVAVVLDQVGGYCEPRLNLNRPTPRSRYDAGHTVFVPADATVWAYTDGIQAVRELRLSFEPNLLDSILGEDLDVTKPNTPLLMLYDDKVAGCAALIAEECRKPSGGSRLYGESLTTALTAALFGSAKVLSKEREQGLARWQLRRALEYLEENLSRDISLDEIANLVGLSQSQFARAFKASTGLPPYRWCLQARVKRAQALLQTGGGSIAEIALQTGFADQSHFTKVFRQITGAPPRMWQRDQRF